MTFLTANVVSGLNFIKGRICQIYVPSVHFFLAQSQTFAEPLEMDNLSLPQEANHIIYIRVIGQSEDVIVSEAGLLLWCNHESATCG